MVLEALFFHLKYPNLFKITPLCYVGQIIVLNMCTVAFEICGHLVALMRIIWKINVASDLTHERLSEKNWQNHWE